MRGEGVTCLLPSDLWAAGGGVFERSRPNSGILPEAVAIFESTEKLEDVLCDLGESLRTNVYSFNAPRENT